MNIAYLNYEDTIGRRFNGYDFAMKHVDRDLAVNMFVHHKGSDAPFVHRLWPALRSKLYKYVHKMEEVSSLHNILFPPALIYRKPVRSADLLHVNLISGSFLSFWELALLSHLKPMVLQLHEFSPVTGHCSYPPQGCQQWLNGCKCCQALSNHFPLRRNTAGLLWKYKKTVWKNSKLDLIVACRWLLDQINLSPMFGHCEKHVVPFGLDTNVFKPVDKQAAKVKLNIPPDNFVIFFRALNYYLKGTDTIYSALERLQVDQPVTLLTINGDGTFKNLSGKYQVLDYGWVSDQQTMVNLFQAADLFLMPSVQETFGMMAMEAMSCGLPIIVSEGTSLVEVTKAPDGALAIPPLDMQALCEAIELMIRNGSFRQKLAMRARQLALEHYKVENYHRSLIELYKYVLEKRSHAGPASPP